MRFLQSVKAMEADISDNVDDSNVVIITHIYMFLITLFIILLFLQVYTRTFQASENFLSPKMASETKSIFVLRVIGEL